MNPFSKRREQKEAALQQKLEQLQQQQQQRVGGGEMMSEADMRMLSSGAASAGTAGGAGDASYESEDFDKYLPAAAKVEDPDANWAPPPAQYQYYEPPSRMKQCVYRLGNGFAIGAMLGSAIGTMYGTYAAIAHRHILYLPIAIVTSAGGFGFFLACGTVIRCDEGFPQLEDERRVCEQRALPYVTRRQAFDDTPGLLYLPGRAPPSAASHVPALRERSAVVTAIVCSDLD